MLSWAVAGVCLIIRYAVRKKNDCDRVFVPPTGCFWSAHVAQARLFVRFSSFDGTPL